jgi:hypothetical protein
LRSPFQKLPMLKTSSQDLIQDVSSKIIIWDFEYFCQSPTSSVLSSLM